MVTMTVHMRNIELCNGNYDSTHEDLTGTVEATGEVSPLSVVASFTSPGSLTPSLP